MTFKYLYKEYEEIVQEQLYVPFGFNQQAKDLGARWNGKNWYTFRQQKNYLKLVDTFHKNNFITTKSGTKMKSVITTEREREREKERIKIEKLRNKYKDTAEYKDNYAKEKIRVLEEYGDWDKEDENHFIIMHYFSEYNSMI